MKRFELQIGVFIDAENEEDLYNKTVECGLHKLLNELDAEDGYESEVVSVKDILKNDKEIIHDPAILES